MQLWKKQKTFSQIVAAFLKFRSNLNILIKNITLKALCVFDITDCERGG